MGAAPAWLVGLVLASAVLPPAPSLDVVPNPDLVGTRQDASAHRLTEHEGRLPLVVHTIRARHCDQQDVTLDSPPVGTVHSGPVLTIGSTYATQM